MHVVGAGRSVIGAVEGVVREPHSGGLYAIVDVGGMLNIDDRVLLPLDRLVPTGIDDELMLPGATEEAVKLHMLYDEKGGYEPVEGYATLGEAAAAVAE